MWQKILVPLQAADACEQLIEPLTDLVLVSNAEVVLLTIIPEQSAEEAEQCARENLALLLSQLRKRGVSARFAMRSGQAVGEIADYAHVNRVDAIAMAAPQYRGLRRLLAPDIVDRVIQETYVPIVLLRPRLR